MENRMLDVVCVIITLVFFAVGVIYTLACDKL